MLNWAIGWALSRLNERTTWAGLILAACAKMGVHLAPQFDTLIINIAIAIVAAVSYAVKGGPVVLKIQPKHK